MIDTLCSEKPWLAAYPEGVPAEIDPDRYASIMDLFYEACASFGQNTAFINMGTSLSYQALDQQSTAFAAYLQTELGLSRGDRVAIMMPNLLQYPIVLFGILKAGCVVVNLNPLYTASELGPLLTRATVCALVVLEQFAHVVEAALPTDTTLPVMTTRVGDALSGLKKPLINFVVKHLKRMVPAYRLPTARSLSDCLTMGQVLAFTPPVLDGQDTAFLQFTGGTTGVPKAAVLTHRNLVANILQCRAWLGGEMAHPEQACVLGALPLYHIFSLTVCCLAYFSMGVSCLLITNPRDLSGFIQTLKQYPVTVFVGLNTLFNGLLNHPKFAQLDFSALEMTVGGGMAVQPHVAERWQSVTGCPILQGYGLTEASPVVSINPVSLDTFHPSIGLPIPSTEVMLRDGELWVRGPQVMVGYDNAPEETAKVLDAEGWLATGDIAEIDAQGFIHLIDRKKDMVLVSGFNVYPNEVEAVLVACEGVSEAAVIGVPDEQSGEVVKAFIVSDQADLTAERVMAHCRQHLTPYKCPKHIEFRSALPKSTVGKILRKALREAP